MTIVEYAAAYQSGFQGTLRSLRARGLSPLEAEEIAQSAWCRGCAHLTQLREPRAVYRWVNSIALNLSRTVAKRRRLFCAMLPEQAATVASLDTDISIDINRTLQLCSAGQRWLLRKHYLYGSSRQEIADNLCISRAAVDQRVSRALARIRRTVRNV